MNISKTPQELFNENTRLVHFIVLKFRNSRDPHYEDLISEGMIGLWKACNTYDSSKSTFATYAGRCITNEILMYMRKLRKPILLHTVSYDTLLMNDKEDTVRLEEFLSDPRSSDDYDRVDATLSLQGCFSCLTEKERIVIYRMYYLDEKQADIAKIIGASQSYVSRLAKSAINKLKKVTGYSKEAV